MEKFITAGKEEGFKYTDGLIVEPVSEVNTRIEELRKNGYRFFRVLTETDHVDDISKQHSDSETSLCVHNTPEWQRLTREFTGFNTAKIPVKTPEEKLGMYYENTKKIKSFKETLGIRMTLAILGINIDGITDEGNTHKEGKVTEADLVKNYLTAIERFVESASTIVELSGKIPQVDEYSTADGKIQWSLREGVLKRS